MKKLINKTVLLLSFLLVLGACDDKEIIELNPDANTVVSLSTNSLILTEETASDDILTVSWTDPNFGFDAAASYQILIDFAGGDFTAPQIFSVGSSLSKTLTVGELNGKLLSLGARPTEETDLEFVVQTTLSDAQVMVSDPVMLTATAYSSLLDLSTAWGLVGSATPGGWGNEFIPDVPFYTTSTPNVFVTYATLREGPGMIKIRKDNLWTENFGSSDVTLNDGVYSGSLEASGPDIAIEGGNYKITFNQSDLTFKAEPYTWGLVGDFSGWAAPDYKLEYNSYQDNWKGVVTLTDDGNVKFRFNNDWGTNYGGSGLSGSLELGGNDIALEAGHYLVTMDLNNLEYSFEEIDVWGIVGSATPNGWGSGGPDTKFIPDFGINEGVYYINGIELWNNPSATDIGDMIKIRQNDAWGLNYGSSDFTKTDSNGIISYVGSLESGGSDMALELGEDEKGIYNIVFDSNANTIAVYKW